MPPHKRLLPINTPGISGGFKNPMHLEFKKILRNTGFRVRYKSWGLNKK